MRAKAAGAARTRGAAGLGRVPVSPEVGDDPDRRAPPVGVVFLPVGDADSGSPAATRLPAPRLGPHAKDPLRAL